MKIVVAADSFKGSLSSAEAGEAIKEGILNAFPDSEVSVFSISDGGEGMAAALSSVPGAEIYRTAAHDPLGRPIECEYTVIKDKNGSLTAAVEIASAAGLTLLDESERNPMITSTFGVGEIILDALKRGIRTFIIGIGGSATNDGGIGMLSALGAKFIDSNGNHICHGCAALTRLAEIDLSDMEPSLAECTFHAACDVSNPLCGENGASRIFSPQKGAAPEDIPIMDRALFNYAKLLGKQLPNADPDAPGAGAAGGCGFALNSVLNASLERGIDIIMNMTGLFDALRSADLIVTGEGRLDSQSIMGKVPSGIAEAGARFNIPVIAIAGSVSDDASVCNSHGIAAFFPAVRHPCTLSEALDPHTARANLTSSTEQIFRLIKLSGAHSFGNREK